MKHLYAPWRGHYTKTSHRHEGSDGACPFCLIIASNDDTAHYVLKRHRHVVVLLNLYPYNPGHLLIIPTLHHAQLHLLEPQVRNELMEVISGTIATVTGALGCDGMNVGINLGGACAGGSIPEHLHIHLVPRWSGDTNFMPVIAQTKQLSEDLHAVYTHLRGMI